MNDSLYPWRMNSVFTIENVSMGCWDVVLGCWMGFEAAGKGWN